jgi:hypothetical protein
MNIAISLGKNCESAIVGVESGLRMTREQGYKTCPFDLCVTNYEGMVKCLEEDFLHFCDTRYLELIPYSSKELHVSYAKEGELIIKNTYYNFLFNHESPEHTTFHQDQKWPGGKNHFVDNSFKFFIERYNQRIDNFRNYMNSNNNISFLLKKEDENDEDTTALQSAMMKRYPSMDYEIFHIR